MPLELVGIKFNSTAKIYHFDSGGLELNVGDKCIVQTERGEELGTVVMGFSNLEHLHGCGKSYKKILRKADEEDCEIYQRKASREREAFNYCVDKIRERKLAMKLVNTELSSDGKKITFYFTAEERVDFRELVKDIAQRFRTRIEMRQIGVRDEARVMGGFGCCGRPLCCTTFITQFEPISIKMAKNQSLSLNPSKISGLCGRLMCCLRYEFEDRVSGRRQEKNGELEMEITEDELLTQEEEDVICQPQDNAPEKSAGSPEDPSMPMDTDLKYQQ
ncbi:MAG: stage 0 sporulation family protein [Acidobacteriota bacterium]